MRGFNATVGCRGVKLFILRLCKPNQPYLDIFLEAAITAKSKRKHFSQENVPIRRG